MDTKVATEFGVQVQGTRFLETSGPHSYDCSGPLPSAGAICYPVKVTRATLTSSNEVQAAVGFPVSTAITPLNEPDVVAVTERPSDDPLKPTVSVLGELRERPLAGAILYPLRTTTETLTGDEGRSSPAPNLKLKLAIAQTVAMSAKSARQSKLKSRSLVSDMLNATLVLSALLLVWRVASLHVADRQPISGPNLAANVASNQRPAAIAEESREPTKSTGSTSAATQILAIEPPVSGTPSGSDQGEKSPVKVSPATETTVSTTTSPNPPQKSLVPATSGLDVAVANAETAIQHGDKISGHSNPLDALSTLAEGQRRIQGGDVYGAREAFRLAVDMGMAQAALALGSTYDPRSLAEMGIRDVVPDAATALSWYRRAHLMAGPATDVSQSAEKNN